MYGVSLVVEHARYRHRRRGDARVARRLVRITVHEIGGVLHAQPWLHVDDAFGFDVELLVFLVTGVVDAVLLEHTARNVVRCHVAAARYAYVMLDPPQIRTCPIQAYGSSRHLCLRLSI